MTGLQNYYNSLLGIEVAVLGICVAVFFVFIQIIYSRFSDREVQLILKDTVLIIFMLLSVVLLGWTAFAGLSLTLGQYDFVPQYYFHTQELVSAGWMLVLIWIGLGGTVALFLGAVLRNFRYLQPSQFLLDSLKRATTNAIESFLHKKYGIVSPKDNRMWRMSVVLAQFDQSGKVQEEVLDTETTQLKAQEEELEQSMVFDRQMKRYSYLTKISQKATDPFASANQIAIDALVRLDLVTYNRFLESVTAISDRFIKVRKKIEGWPNWDANRGLLSHYLEHLIDMFNAHAEVIQHQGLGSVILSILDTTQSIAEMLVDSGNTDSLKVLTNFWKRIAETRVTSHPVVVKRVINLFEKTAERIMDQHNEKDNGLDEMFVCIGWLGEKLFIGQSYHEEPLMPDDWEYKNQTQNLFAALFSISAIYDQNHPDWYPLIYFDAVDVVFRRLMMLTPEESKHITNFPDVVFQLYYIFYSFGVAAIKVGNRSGADLAATNLRNAIKSIVASSFKDMAAEALKMLFKLGATAAGHSDKFTTAGFLNDRLDDWIHKELVGMASASDVYSEGLEIYLHADGDRKAVERYMFRVGYDLHTDFGLNLKNPDETQPDSSTEEDGLS
ncbi:MAG: hypothetical protein WC553_00985 [Patescibacteria group bacterium]